MLDPSSLAGRTAQLAEPAAPYVLTVVASTGAYSIGLAATQVAGLACRVSCATPVLGSVMGCMGVGLASCMAGQAALWCRSQRPEIHGWSSFSRSGKLKVMAQDAVMDAAIGIFLFKAMGGRFRSLLPSDLFKAGALAVESLPATRGPEYATVSNRGELFRLMRRDGCHHCGRRRGKVVGDHIPPNKLAAVNSAVLPDSLTQLLQQPLASLHKRTRSRSGWLNGKRIPQLPKPLRSASDALGLAKEAQRYYPQCGSCSQRQAAAVRAGRRTLVMHFGGPRPWFFAGALVGLRHFQAPPSPSGGARHRRRPLLVLGLASGESTSAPSLPSSSGANWGQSSGTPVGSKRSSTAEQRHDDEHLKGYQQDSSCAVLAKPWLLQLREVMSDLCIPGYFMQTQAAAMQHTDRELCPG